MLRLHPGVRLDRGVDGAWLLSDDARALRGVPLTTADAETLGTVCVDGSDGERRELGWPVAIDVLLHGAASGDRRFIESLRGDASLSSPERALLRSLARSRRMRPRRFDAFSVWVFVIGAVVRQLSVVLIVTSLLLGAMAIALDLPARQIPMILVLPLLIPVVIGTHESAHWMTMLRLTSARASGALLVRGRQIAVLTPDLDTSTMRRVAAAGPCAGIAVCAIWTGIWAFIGDPFGIAVGILLGVSQLLGLTPLSKDGRALLGIRT